MIILYQFPISHFCEKIRWALDFKNLAYTTKNLLPGPHIKQVMAIAKTSEVPVLKHDEIVIQKSAKIIDFLDKTYPQNSLMPDDESLQKQVKEWERFADKEIGPNLRTFFYHTLLDHPQILIPIFTYNGPWYGKIFMKLFFPKLRKTMIRYMKLDDSVAALAKQNLKQAIDKLNTHLLNRKFIVGEQFSRADLAVAALLAPLVQPLQYGLPWPAPLPPALQNTIDEWSDELVWVRAMYNDYR